MTELQILGAAVTGIGLSIWLIVKVGVHPFLAILCGAFILGCLAGLGPHDSITAMQAGFADVLGGTGPVIALGLLRFPAEFGHQVQVGDLIGCGISHPCTTFDKWPLLLEVDDEYRVIGAVNTVF